MIGSLQVLFDSHDSLEISLLLLLPPPIFLPRLELLRRRWLLGFIDDSIVLSVSTLLKDLPLRNELGFVLVRSILDSASSLLVGLQSPAEKVFRRPDDAKKCFLIPGLLLLPVVSDVGRLHVVESQPPNSRLDFVGAEYPSR